MRYSNNCKFCAVNPYELEVHVCYTELDLSSTNNWTTRVLCSRITRTPRCILYFPSSGCHRFPKCPNLCDEWDVYCKDHQQHSTDVVRGGADARGYNAKWRTARKRDLQKYPLCAQCRRNGRITPATVIDHIMPHGVVKRCFGTKKLVALWLGMP